jgi:surface polysaccharide O-acyltransferase-like enzyme
MSANRSAVIDLTKIILAFLVINFHLESFVFKNHFSAFYFLGWYAVPVFVIISFYLNSHFFMTSKLSVNVLFKKIRRLLIPLLFWSGVGFMTHADLISPKYIFRQLFFGTAVDPPLYYLNIVIYLMIIWFILGYLKIKLRKVALFSLILIALIFETFNNYSLFLDKFPIQSQFFLHRFFELSKYAAIGSLLPDFVGLINKYRRLTNKILPVIVPLLITLDITLAFKIPPPLLGYGGSLKGLAIILLSLLIINIKNYALPNIFSQLSYRIGQYVLGIYCLHYFFIELIEKNSHLYLLATSQLKIITVSLIFSIAFLLSVLISKIFHGKLEATVS